MTLLRLQLSLATFSGRLADRLRDDLDRLRTDEDGLTTTEIAVATFLLVGAAIVVMGIIYVAARSSAENIPVPQAPTG